MMERRMDEWMDGSVDGWMDGWVCGWIDVLMDEDGSFLVCKNGCKPTEMQRARRIKLLLNFTAKLQTVNQKVISYTDVS